MLTSIRSAAAATWVFLRAVGRVLVTAFRFGRKIMPRWLAPVFAVCLVIPGPLDEIAMLAVVGVIVIRSGEHRAALVVAVREAWQG